MLALALRSISAIDHHASRLPPKKTKVDRFTHRKDEDNPCY
jgi:hypothetical protein